MFLLIMINFSPSGFEPFWHDINQATITALSDYSNVNYSRFNIWAIALDMFNSSPLFGTGLGSFMHNEMVGGFHTISAIDYQQVHNDLLELLVELGLFGVVFFLVVFFLIQAVIRRAKNQHKNALFYILSLIGILASFVNMQFSSPYQNAYPLLLFGLLPGLISQSSPVVLSIQISSTIFQFKGSIVVVTALESSIYIQWIGVYSHINKFVDTKKIRYLNTANSIVYHQDLQTMLKNLAYSYDKRGAPILNILVENKILTYWEDNFLSLIRKVCNLYRVGRYKLVLKH
ncbi:O-antigen ligase family protein [Isorropodon fossajaponicum symbiont]|uniref:O-antigen ligase family protein n=1 Tax=Isorropodon fossajaponicum symbiont TaxID=883811 RepID=UPI00315AAC92